MRCPGPPSSQVAKVQHTHTRSHAGQLSRSSHPCSSSNATGTTTVVLPAGTVIGSVPPVRLETFGSVQATGVGPACPQMTGLNITPLLLDVIILPDVEETLYFGTSLGDETEDCLTISVMRPEGTAAAAKLPVLFWIFGGGFETGSPQAYNGSVLIPQSVGQGKPMILVAVNYRLGDFGFLGGSEVLADGAANLGLLDQRMGLEWVADNVAGFGGDPDAVIIWGESGGSMSVFDQLAIFDGNNTSKGRPLFRGAIMDSGSITPTEPVDSAKAQEIFDTVVEAAGCASVADSGKLECLRGIGYETFLKATNSVSTYLSYSSPAFNYAPRPDGRTLTASPEVLAETGKYATVPIIIGNQENEVRNNICFIPDQHHTKADLIFYLNDVFFHNATSDEVAALVDTYPDNPDSPAGIGASNATYPEFKRLAAILGDWELTFMSRLLLETFPFNVPAWSYQATYANGTPILGTYHSTDVPHLFYETDDVSTAIQALYISFVDSLDPNNYAAGTACGYLTPWPTWQERKQLLELGAQSTRLIYDDARAASFDYIQAHLKTLRL
ncbi:Alpha/Beta hydrolase protein [Truncatella angustata]|uniref:Carboxylic ester hydrolase n=1 Tax=Truncatella angustata TaxID=152316 RepID=A0A9P8RJE9_9PEZI|nr:Alpha/Beta hydrolase protein [Truncatella angustata]KAH6638518.1 Alpha/Beta hydrolase protein [Truncatella angustata]